MYDTLAKNLAAAKRTFASEYSGSAHIQEIIPTSPSAAFEIDGAHLKHLHHFASSNPIYHNSYQADINGTGFTVYEGDINEYWLDSIKHGSSCQPFYPTWLVSAYVLAMSAAELGCSELIDVGSGDGRIAYCGSVAGMQSHSIEIDGSLAQLQERISESTSITFNPVCGDALEYDYAGLGLKRPAFFIGGLAQMGGDVLAGGIMDKVRADGTLAENSRIILAGTEAKRHLSGNTGSGGWEEIIKKHGLRVTHTVTLPTVWTFDQKEDTPYIFTEFCQA